MDILKVQNERKQMISRIESAISEFQGNTGFAVKSVVITTREITPGLGLKPILVERKIDAKCVAELNGTTITLGD